MKELLKGIVAALLSFVFFLVLLEVTLQIYTRLFIYYDVEMSRYADIVKEKSANPKIGHVHRPNSCEHLMGVDMSFNSDGLRDDEYDVARNDKYRIAVLGDSLTLAWGVEKQDSFEVLLEEMLSKSRPTEMINFGHGNYNTQQEVNLFIESGLKYNPDKVVVFYFINDAEVTPVQSKWAWVARLRSVTFLWSRVRGLLTRTKPGQTFETFYKDLYKDDQPGFIAMKEAFLELRDLTAQRGIELQVVMLPELHNLIDYPFDEEYAKVAKFLRDSGINYIDLTDDFRGYQNAPELWVAPDDAHPNAKAQRMIAGYSLDFIEKGNAADE